MMVMSTSNGVVLLGLVAENVERLRAGQPITVDRGACPALRQSVGILYGDTEADIVATLRTQGFGVPDSVGPDPNAAAREIRAAAPEGRVLILTVGLPRAGKSTWARKQVWPVVNPDAIRLELTGETFVPSREAEVWSFARSMVGALFGAGHTTVILNATNMTRDRRLSWRSDRWVTALKLLPTPAAVCRARATDRPDLLPVIDRMEAATEPIGADELMWP